MQNLNDELENGGPGTETQTGTAGNDTVAGAAGNDTTAGAAGTDTAVGAAGADTVTGAAASDKAPPAGKAGKGPKAVAKEPAPKKLSPSERAMAEILEAPDGTAIRLKAARGTIGDAKEPHIVYRSTEHITRRVGDLRANSWLRAQIVAGVIEASPG